MQKPYQMFQIKDQTEEEHNLILQIDAIRKDCERMELKVQLEMKENELLEEKLKKMEDDKLKQDEKIE